MARRKARKGKNTPMITMYLGLIVALLISLYVFDAVLDATLPLNCPATADVVVAPNAAGDPTYNAAAASTAVCVYTNSSNSVVVNTTSLDGFFPQALKFGDDLLPVMGILGIFFIIRGLIRKL